MADKSFSLKIVLITAAVTFLVSGVGGALFNRFLDRGQPFSYIESMSFSASSDDYLALPDIILKASQKSDSVKRYSGLVAAAELEADYSVYSAELSRLRTLDQALTEWGKKGFENPPSATFEPVEIGDLPVLVDPFGRDVLARLLGTLPKQDLSRLEECERKMDASYTAGELGAVDSVQVALLGSTYTFQSERQLLNSEKLRWSGFATILECGAREPLANTIRAFRESVQNESTQLQSVISALKTLLERNSRLKAEVIVQNRGGRPLLISPFATLSFPGTKMPDIRLRVTPPPRKRQPDVMDRLGGMLQKYAGDLSGRRMQQSSGSPDIGSPLLPAGGLFRYMSVSGGEGIRLTLDSADALGSDKFLQLKQLFESGAVEARVVIQLEDGGVFESSRTSFGKVNAP